MKRGFVLFALVAAAAMVIVTAGPEESFGMDGSFILWDEYPGKVEGDPCTGERSLYYSINASAEVKLMPCLFGFQFTIDSRAGGADGYLIRLGSWGELTMSQEDLRKPGAVQMSIGLR